MKRRAIPSQVSCILSMLLLLGVVAVPSASAEFYVIAGSRGVGTQIKSLPYTISSSGFYYITQDLSCAATNNGITITADNVTLDLMGFSLVGPGGIGSIYDGISMEGKINVEIRNGTVRNFQRHGIYESGNGVGHRIINVRVRDNSYAGVYLLGKGHTVARCTVVANGSNGIYVSYGSMVIGNTCRDNMEHGIYLIGNNLVDQNNATGNNPDMNGCETCTFGTNHTPITSLP